MNIMYSSPDCMQAGSSHVSRLQQQSTATDHFDLSNYVHVKPQSGVG